MKVTGASWISALLVAATVGVALWAWQALPPGAGVPTHYLGLDGHRHAGVSRTALWLIPLVSAIVTTSARRLGAERSSLMRLSSTE
jgi:hypothetical protein